MIINNLEHVENVNAANKIQGSAAESLINFNVLGLGTRNSISFGNVESLAVSSPGVNISGLSGFFAAGAN